MKAKFYLIAVVFTLIVNTQANAQCQCKILNTCYDAGCNFINRGLCIIFGGQWFIGSSCGVILPIELSEFSIEKLEDNNILIHWTTSSERNNMKFILEYSFDAVNWNILDEIPGAVNSVESKEYSYIDKNIKLSNTIYYRLSQEDIDGKTELITVDFIEIESSELVLYPNPANNDLNILFPKLYLDNYYEIYSADGKQMYKSIGNENATTKIDLNNFSDGIYWFKFYNNKELNIKKFIVRKQS